MKIRDGFVSNSSSSSFCIEKEHLAEQQIDHIHHHLGLGTFLNAAGVTELFLGLASGWEITETEDCIKGYTFMDNFDMHEFLAAIGVDPGVIDWDENGH